MISGVNDGPNTGVAQLNSGTVGAAARAVRYGYPAIAASIGYLFTAEEMKAGWPSTHHWPDSADTVSLVDAAQQVATRAYCLWDPGSVLTTRHWRKTPSRGEKYIGNERFPAPQHYYKLLDDGRAQQMMSEKVLEPTEADTDTGWLNKGHHSDAVGRRVECAAV